MGSFNDLYSDWIGFCCFICSLWERWIWCWSTKRKTLKLAMQLANGQINFAEWVAAYQTASQNYVGEMEKFSAGWEDKKSRSCSNKKIETPVCLWIERLHNVLVVHPLTLKEKLNESFIVFTRRLLMCQTAEVCRGCYIFGDSIRVSLLPRLLFSWSKAGSFR